MARRWAWWTGLSLLAVVLLTVGAWRLAREIPERMRVAEDTIRREAAALGLKVSFRNLKFHPLYLRIAIDDLAVDDALSGRPLARAESADASLSIAGILSGGTPVSRIRVRNYTLDASEENRALFEKLRASPSKEGGEPLPEILLVGGRIRVGPLGPVRRFEAVVPEFRIRHVRFLGTRVSLDLKRASGDLLLPVAGDGRLPFDSGEADVYFKKGVLRVRRLTAEGLSASLRVSGKVDTEKRTTGLKASGTADIARWIAAGAPGSRRLADLAGQGKVEFTLTADGSFAEPVVAARAVLMNGRLGGDTPAEGEVSVAVSGRRLRVESLKGRLWGGTLAGRGTYDFAAGAGEGKLSLSRAALGGAPWGKWGFSWKPAGAGDVSLSASGGPGKVDAEAFLSVPDGLERADGSRARAIRVPLSAAASVAFVPGRDLRFASLKVRAGNGELSGSGSVSLDKRAVDLAGAFSLPAGRAADYGWDYPLSWKALSGDWGVTGAAAHPRVAAGIKARALAMRALPPVPAVVKIDGDPTELIHFVADVPADVVSVTATGTVTGPFSADPFLLEATVGAREIDFARCGPWVGAVLSSLGRDPSPADRYASGLAGTGSADIELSIGKAAATVSGTAALPKFASRGIEARAVLVDGSIGIRGGDVRWDVKAGGVVADGSFEVRGKGDAGAADIAASLERADLGAVASLALPEHGRRISGPVALKLGAHYGPRGWEVGRFSASAPKVAVGGAVFEGVTAEGSLGAAAGRLEIAVASPAASAAAAIRRESGWPARIRIATDNVATVLLARAAGRSDLQSSGTWRADGEAIVRLADLFDPRKPVRDSIPEMRFSLAAAGVRIGGVGFETADAEGRKDGDAIAGKIRTHSPETGLAFSVSLREPYAFRLDGPFTVGEPVRAAPAPGGNGNGRADGRTRLFLSGRARVEGAVGVLRETRGTLQVGELDYRTGGIEITGREIAVLLEKEGARWGGGAVHVAGNPLRVSGKATWGGDLDVRLDGAIPAATIRLVTDVFERLDGTMRMELRLTGNYKSPSVVGTGRLDGGIFSFRGYGQLFEDMSAEALISREKIVFEHFQGRSGGGYVDGRGELPLRFDAGQKMYFSVDFFDVRYPYPEDFRPTVQGHAELFGPVEDLMVTGEVEVQSARYTKNLEPENAFLDFRRRLADVTARREKTEFRVRLDIDVIADGTLRVKNNLADVEAKGEFKVVGDTSRVVILGSFDTIEGKVTYRGNQYEIKRLAVDFQDPRRNNPRLDARAETRKGNVTVAVSVTGTLEKYEVELSSDPPLSKNDIVSLLSLGVTSAGLAGAEGSVGAGTAAGLALGPYKSRVEEGIRGIVGLDKFTIEPSFSAATKTFEPKFIVGKSFGDRFSVSASSNVGASTDSSVTAEVKLLENIYLQGGWESTTTSSAGDLGGDLKFRYRYRQFKDLLRGRE